MGITPLKAIRAKCLDCCCGSAFEVKMCTAEQCPLFSFRFGKSHRKNGREMTEEEKEQLIHRLGISRKTHQKNSTENDNIEEE